MAIEASVIICTHNRSQLLDEVLASLNKMDYPRQSCELIVVDNASSDDTRSVVERWQRDGIFPLRYVYEGQLGLSHARNVGVRYAQGELLAFIDDDAVADPRWLAALAEAFESDEHTVCAAGMIDLYWDVPRPKWMPKELEGYLGCNTILGNARREMPTNHNPFGGNMAFRRWAVLSVGGFDLHFGRIGAYLGTNDEPRIADQLRKIGKIVYTPYAKVHHHVPAWRATRRYFTRLAILQGVSNAKLQYAKQPRTRMKLLRSLLADILFLSRESLGIFKGLLQMNQQRTFASYVFVLIRLGQMYQTLRLAFFPQ